MSKLIAVINITLDGFCDHTAITPDEEIHKHYTDLLNNAGVFQYENLHFFYIENGALMLA